MSHSRAKKVYRNGMYKADLMCLGCGNPYQIPRPLTKHRPYGHIKDAFCPVCGDGRYIEYGFYGRNEWQDAELAVNDV